jgi:hypothetical protein
VWVVVGTIVPMVLSTKKNKWQDNQYVQSEYYLVTKRGLSLQDSDLWRLYIFNCTLQSGLIMIIIITVRINND